MLAAHWSISPSLMPAALWATCCAATPVLRDCSSGSPGWSLSAWAHGWPGKDDKAAQDARLSPDARKRGPKDPPLCAVISTAYLRRFHHEERIHIGIHGGQGRRLILQVLKQHGGEVAFAEVGHHYHDQLAGIFFAMRYLQSLRHCRAAGDPDTDPLFLRHPARDIQRLVQCRRQHLIDEVSAKHIRHKAGANPLDLVRPGLSPREDGRVRRLYGNDLEAGLLRLDELAHAGQRSARAHA